MSPGRKNQKEHDMSTVKHYNDLHQLHRDGDQPAIICSDGTRLWYRDGLCHRDGGKPAVIRADGAQEWYLHGVKQPEPSPEPTDTCEINLLDARLAYAGSSVEELQARVDAAVALLAPLVGRYDFALREVLDALIGKPKGAEAAP